MRPLLVALLALSLAACRPPCDFKVRGMCVSLAPEMVGWRDIPARVEELVEVAENYCGPINLDGWYLEFTHDEVCGDIFARGCTNHAPWWVGGDVISIQLGYSRGADAQCIEHEAVVHELCHVAGYDDKQPMFRSENICQLWPMLAAGNPECTVPASACWW